MQYIYIFIFFISVILKGSVNRMMDFMPILIMMVGIIHYGLFKRNKFFVGYILKKNAFYTFSILILLTIISIIRSHNPYISTASIVNDIISLLLFIIFLYLSFSYNFYRKGSFKFNAIFSIKAFITGTTIVSLIFFVLYIVSPPQAGEPGVILKAIGLNISPRKFPLIDVHPNILGIFTGGIFVMQVLNLYILKSNPRQKLLFFCMAATCFVFILFIDSRGTLINTILTLSIIFVLHRVQSLKTVKFSPLLIPGLPLIFLFILPFIAQSELGNKLSRGNNDLASGNSRAIVWEYCFDEIADVKPIHLIGYGENGQYPAGVSPKYGKLFGPEKENKYTVTHSNFLQLVFDQGYIGLLFMLIVLVITLTQLVEIYHSGNYFVLILIGFILYFILSGTTESIYGTYNRIYLYLIIGVLLLSNIIYNEFRKDIITAQN